ncbi:MAG TPA: hypothetical protein VNG29_01220, partial [Candidatus Paceibacterota bacterium]|nr:hypothetical protein [Candidatus Paceibacterota bacterium]
MKKWAGRSFLTLLLLVGLPAGTALAVQIYTNIPGLPATNTSPTAPCDTVFGFYQFALMLGGVLAFAAITYGGIKYTLAAGNPSKQS